MTDRSPEPTEFELVTEALACAAVGVLIFLTAPLWFPLGYLAPAEASSHLHRYIAWCQRIERDARAMERKRRAEEERDEE